MTPTIYETQFDGETYRIRMDLGDPASYVECEGEEPGEWETTCWGRQAGGYTPQIAMWEHIECVMQTNEIDPYEDGNEKLLASIGEAAEKVIAKTVGNNEQVKLTMNKSIVFSLSAEWCHNDEDREVVYESLLRYDIDGDEIQINAISLCCAVDWHYDKKQGASIDYPDESKIVVEKWLMSRIRDEEAVGESAEAACRKDYEDHLEILQERDHDSEVDF